MASGEAIPVEPLQHKTIVLKTSIHCPGCSRKVKRIIQSIPGVYNFAIDPSQNKVSITGDVEADVIVKKFLKSNKQVELWPEKKPKPTTANTNTSSGKNQSKEINTSSDPNQSKEINTSSDPNQSKEINTSSDPSEKKKKPDERFKEKKPFDKSDATATNDSKIVNVAQEAAKEPSKSDNGPEKSPNENDPKSQQGRAIANIDDSNKKSENQEAKSGGDSGNKKKEKMVHKEINSGDRAAESSATEGMTEGMTSLPPLQQPQNMMYHAPTAAAYVMSYNMAQPSTAHSYYAFPPTPPPPPPPPPPSTQGYFYSPYPPQPPPPEFFYGQPSEWGSPAPPPESYHMFNDENANSCNVM